MLSFLIYLSHPFNLVLVFHSSYDVAISVHNIDKNVQLDLGEMTYDKADVQPELRPRGNAASQFLQNKGYGWLLEVDDSDDDDDKAPLL